MRVERVCRADLKQQGLARLGGISSSKALQGWVGQRERRQRGGFTCRSPGLSDADCDRRRSPTKCIFCCEGS